VAKRTGLSITCFPKFALTNEEMFRLFSRSVAYVGLSKSDGISASMIEAMANGAVPIQSDSSCGAEWLQDGVGGFLVDYQDINTVARLVSRVVRDQDFQRAAAKVNFEALAKKLSPEQVQRDAEITYSGLAQA
jgi:glycosyltransferase involved in cell wall biosynthesis